MSAPLTRSVRQALRRIPVILAEHNYATDSSLCADLNLDFHELRTAISILYRQRRADRIGIYIVPSASPRMLATLPGAPDQAA